MTPINVLSLFDGISCGQIALARAGIPVNQYFASEIDKHAIKVTQHNWPDTIQLGDVTKIHHVDYSRPIIDLLIGGSPCQSLSRSGNGAGFMGKSGLFYEYVRVLSEVKEKNPEIQFLLENVVMKKEWESVISKILGVQPIKICSSLVSAQKRERLYWSNIPFNGVIENRNIFIKDIVDVNNKNYVESELLYFEDGEFRVKNNTAKGYLTVNNYDCVNLDFPKSKTRRGRVSYSKSNTLNTGCNQAYFVNGRLIKLNRTELERLQTLPEGYTSSVTESTAKTMIGNGWTVDVIVEFFKHLKSPENV